MALSSTVLRPKLYTESEQENGKAAWLLGASFITEGAIPFAAADPLRVIPSLMAGSALTGALVMAFGCELRAPHGGIWVIGLVSNPLLYIVAIAAGTALSAFLVTALEVPRAGSPTRRSRRPSPTPRSADPDGTQHTTHERPGAGTEKVSAPGVCVDGRPPRIDPDIRAWALADPDESGVEPRDGGPIGSRQTARAGRAGDGTPGSATWRR